MFIHSFYTAPVSSVKMKGTDGKKFTTAEQKSATASQFETDFKKAEKKRQAYSKELQTMFINDSKFRTICQDQGLNIKAAAQKKADELATAQIPLPTLPGFDYSASFEKLERRY